MMSDALSPTHDAQRSAPYRPALFAGARIIAITSGKGGVGKPLFQPTSRRR